MKRYSDFFRQATQLGEPYPYQGRLAAEPWPDLLDIPTGLGKTAAVTLAWLWKRGWRRGGRTEGVDPETPRRLIWCLPMRVLAEQTEASIRRWLSNLEILGQGGEARVSDHLLMGGEPDANTWAEHPDEDMIIIGTQDMLLSRALMRGYGMSRYQWPVHFALLHNDSLWAFDEVQLMGAGLTTSAQLEGLRRSYPVGQGSRSLWLSATLNPDWLSTFDLAPHLPDFERAGLDETDRGRMKDRLNASKSLQLAQIALALDAGNKAGASDYLETLVDAVLGAHDPSAQTLVIVNRVDRAQGLFVRLQQRRAGSADLLVHARFRPEERRIIERRLKEESETDRIVVATQAIEAGVDISSRVLFTELAPWASLVQRFGRCNRYGEHNDAGGARVYWIDIADDADSLPYDSDTLAAARAKLEGLGQVGPADLPVTDEARPLTAVLRRKDLLDLFNTDPDLSGFDVDVSDYIRDSGAPGMQVFWREVVDPNVPDPQPLPVRNELCPVSLGQARALGKRSVWHWDSLTGQWESLHGNPRPGMTLLLSAKEGGYDPVLGFYPGARQAVPAVAPEGEGSHERYGADWRSSMRLPVGLENHLEHVAEEAERLCGVVGEIENAAEIVRAARWHDLGKAHPVFDASMHRCEQAPPRYLAKSNCSGPMRHERPHFRHELASALAWLAQHDRPAEPNDRVDLIAYLIAAHHGKVRTSLRALPEEIPAPKGRRFARGIWEGDRLPALEFATESSVEVSLRLDLMELGEGEQGKSWTARVLEVLEHYGPFRLAWLESLVRIADWRASASEQEEHGHA